MWYWHKPLRLIAGSVFLSISNQWQVCTRSLTCSSIGALDVAATMSSVFIVCSTEVIASKFSNLLLVRCLGEAVVWVIRYVVCLVFTSESVLDCELVRLNLKMASLDSKCWVWLFPGTHKGHIVWEYGKVWCPLDVYIHFHKPIVPLVQFGCTGTQLRSKCNLA